MRHQQQRQDPEAERWTAAPIPVDQQWLERFTSGIRLRGSEGSAAIESLPFGNRADHELRQPPRRAAA